MKTPKILHVCAGCWEGGIEEACGHVNPAELCVMPDGRQLCENCFDEMRPTYRPREYDDDEDADCVTWAEMPKLGRGSAKKCRG